MTWSRMNSSASSSDKTSTILCSNHILGTALPPPSVGGLRRRGPVTWSFAGSRPASSRRPRAVHTGVGSATPRRGACAQDRQIDGSSVRARAHLLLRRRARVPQPPAELVFGIRREHPIAVAHGLTGVLRSRSLAVRARARPCVFSEGAFSMRCPGSGPSVRSSGSRFWTVAPVSPRISARQPEPTAGGELAVAFGACSRRTSGSPSCLLLSSRS
jgi:hypothetical protein